MSLKIHFHKSTLNKISPYRFTNIRNVFSFIILSFFIYTPPSVSGQTLTNVIHHTDTLKPRLIDSTTGFITVSGIVTDFKTGKPLDNIIVKSLSGSVGTLTDSLGRYSLPFPGVRSKIKFEAIGYQTELVDFDPMKRNQINIRLKGTSSQLKEVKVVAKRNPRYRNKGNPSVELIEKVIEHKNENRREGIDYLQFEQDEKVRFAVFDLPPSLKKSRFFKKYGFLLDSNSVINDSIKLSLPFYMDEKRYEIFSRNNPQKQIKVLKASRTVNFREVIDSAGFEIYLNRLYGVPEIYDNNIFVLTNQFLSPISDHSPAFYKFFITDTITNEHGKQIEISFTPRNLGDLLFEGKLYVTTDGRYAVSGVVLRLNHHININFVKNLEINQEFEPNSDGKQLITKNEIKTDFGIFKNKGFRIAGERTIYFKNYIAHKKMDDNFFKGRENQVKLDSGQSNQTYWDKYRIDSSAKLQERVYHNIDSLIKMPSFQRTVWLSKLLIGGYLNLQTFEFGPVENVYAFNSVEGNRIRIGGRTTPLVNKDFYLEGYTAYGFKDQKLKYYLSGIYAFNQKPYWKYPNNYLKIGYQYDTDIPGKNFLIDQNQSLLASFYRGTVNLFQYNRIFQLGYNKEFENHLQLKLGIKNWNQSPAGDLVFQDVTTNNLVNNLTTTEFQLGLRYAPNEQIFLADEGRYTIPNKYPIILFAANYGVKGIYNSSFNYLNVSTNLYKRFYLSQLGYTDINLIGGVVLGKVPFPFLSILPGNQTYLFDKSAYNAMNFLEFVSDHYAGINLTHAFGGFLLNKIPGLSLLKLREFVSAKILYGGLRNENNPTYSSSILKFPTNQNGTQITFPLDNEPYVELGVGVGNIFKVLRLDLIHRFDYLDHPGIYTTGIRFLIKPDL